MGELKRAGVILAVALGVPAFCGSFVSAASGEPDDVADTVAVDPDPVDTVPDTEPDDTTPETTEPVDTEPETTEATGGLVGAGDPDGELDALYVTLAIIGFVGLLAVASWWMVRRDDPDAEPMPPRDPESPTGELI